MALTLATGCRNAEDIFTDGRIENRCTDNIPVCSDAAGCVLTDRQFVRGSLPGGNIAIVRTNEEQSRLRVRFLLSNELFPGSEFRVRAFDTGCNRFAEGLNQAPPSLFEVAGDDKILQYDLDVTGRGDHMVEWFSDMTADFHMTVEVFE